MKCSVCNGKRIIPKVRIKDQGDMSNGYLSVSIDSNPEAMVFKGQVNGILAGRLCCDCGHLDIFCLTNLEEIWAAHLNSVDINNY